MDQIYYEDDPRNATVLDHRRMPPPPPRAPMPPTQTVYMQPAAPPPQRMMYYQPIPAPVAAPAPAPAPANGAAALLGKLTTGQVVEMVVQIFAALQPLPAAPVATKDVSTDLNNMILYQSALAQHAKKDEQVRTAGHLLSRLVG
jgi:hypothetical protein